MLFLQAINSDLSVLIVCNKTGGTIKGDIKKYLFHYVIYKVHLNTPLSVNGPTVFPNLFLSRFQSIFSSLRVRDRLQHVDSVSLITNVWKLPLKFAFIYLRDLWASFYHIVLFPSFFASTISRMVWPSTYEATYMLKRKFVE